MGIFVVYLFRVCMSVAVQKPDADSSDTTIYTEYNYSNVQQGIVLAAFYIGYTLTQIPGSLLSQKYGGKLIYGVGMLGSSIFTFLTPLCASRFYLICAARVCMGLFEGVVYPAQAYMLNSWAPPDERSFLFTICISGAHFGTVCAYPLSSFILTNYGWRSMFYFYSPLGLFHILVWIFVVYETPKRHPTISEAELILLHQSEPNPVQNIEIFPWFIFNYKAVWAILITCFCNTWGFYELLNDLPSYLSSVRNFSIQKAGVWELVPYLLLGFLSNLSGLLADTLIQKGYDRLSVRNAGAIISTIPTAICLVLAGYVESTTVCLLLISFAIGINGSLYVSMTLIFDIGGEYSSIIFGWYNTFGQIPGFLAPLFTGVLTNYFGDKTGYRYSFIVCAFFYVIMLCIWLSWASLTPVRRSAEKEIDSSLLQR